MGTDTSEYITLYLNQRTMCDTTFKTPVVGDSKTSNFKHSMHTLISGCLALYVSCDE